MNPVPVMLIGGGLGSGKTSLLNHLLSTSSHLRLAVVVNEFGDVSIDGALLTDDPASLIELPNGCVCCSTGGDLSAAIRAILSGPPVDMIVVELSGAADPFPVVREVAVLAHRVAVRHVVSLVDVELEPSKAVADPVMLRALTIAHTVVLNKKDRIAPSQLAVWERVVMTTNPQARILLASFGRVPSSDLLVLKDKAAVPWKFAVPRAHAAFHSVTLRLRAGMSQPFVKTMFEAFGTDVDRAKGILDLAEGSFLVQVVRGQCTFQWMPSGRGRGLANRIVLISSRLTAEAMRERAMPWIVGSERSLSGGTEIRDLEKA